MQTELSVKQRRAILMVAEDDITDVEIAKHCGVHVVTLERWKQRPDFQEAVKDHIDALSRDLSRYAIARRDKRIAAMQGRWNGLKQTMDERAEEFFLKEQPGGTTGLIEKQMTPGALRPDYRLDSTLLSEMRQLEKQAAQEAGQWSEKREITGKDGAPLFDLDKPIRVEYVMPDAD